MYNQQKCNTDRTNDKVFAEYKRYKKKEPPPNFSDVIDFCNVSEYRDKVECLDIDTSLCGSTKDYCAVGLKHPTQWQVYELKTSPGFIVVPNPFISRGAQSHWVKQALTSYTLDPYPCNLDVLMKLDKSHSMWETSHQKSPDNTFINQLRWVHMGYHFDYNTVDYKLKKYHGFPEDLALLTKTIAHVFNYPNYVSETGIINYYPEGSTMGGHTDHYENELAQPLIGYTFGQSAIYLIGGQTRDVKPEAIWVRSGDVMLMTGASRTAFHAVPRIMTKCMRTAPLDIGTCPLVGFDDDFGAEESCGCNDGEHWWRNEMKSSSWSEFGDYLSKTRININIRQVHKYQGDMNGNAPV